MSAGVGLGYVGSAALGKARTPSVKHRHGFRCPPDKPKCQADKTSSAQAAVVPCDYHNRLPSGTVRLPTLAQTANRKFLAFGLDFDPRGLSVA